MTMLPARDIIFAGGTIRTMDPSLGSVEALGVADGRIKAAGPLDAVRQAMGAGSITVELAGRTLLPGLIDTHPHLLHYGTLQEPLVDITGARCHAEIVEMIAARARITKPGDWIMTTPVGEPHYFVTRSWRDLQEGHLPDRHILDRATSDHPVMIQAWAPVVPNAMVFNSEALRRLGIDERTPDQNGAVRVEKDARGVPTGIMTGSVGNYYSLDSFNNSLWRQIPFLQLDKMVPAVLRTMKQYNTQGVTAVYENHMMDPPLIDAYRLLRAGNQLTLRVMVAQEAESYGMPWSKPRKLDEFVRRCEEAASAIELDDDLFRFNGMTLLRDGSCWPGFIRMRDEYRGPYGEPSRGMSFITPERAQIVMQACACSGMRLNTIALGTLAHEENLAQLEAMAGKFDIPSLHWILVHAFFLEEEQAKRYARLGMDVTTSLSFSWGKGELFRDRMGEGVLADLIPIRRLLDNKLVVAGGSDWGPKSAFKQIELALTHQFAGSNRNNLGPAQRITREEALAMWTRDAARVLRWRDLGVLRPGNHADIIITDRDPMTCAVEEIGATAVLATLLGGRLVHGALS